MTTFTKSAYLAICLCLTFLLSSCAGGAPSANSGSPGGNAGNPSPSVTSLSPNSAVAGASAQTLTIAGTGFLASSTVTYNGASHVATFVSPTQLTIQLTASDEATAGTFPVVVTNPTPGGGSSAPTNFTVDNPAPAITSLSPSSVSAGAPAQTLTINGTGFVSSSTVTYNGVVHTATFVSSGQLTVQLTASDQKAAGTYPVVVSNPSPGGGASVAMDFTVSSSAPGPTLSGEVFGGAAQNPITGSTVTLYAMGPAGASGGTCSGSSCYGANALSLAQTTTDTTGSFGFSSAAYTCPSGDTADQTYIVATGGNPGSGANAAIGLIALTGPCNQLSGSTFVVVDPLTTAAAEWSLAQFSDSTGSILGTASGNTVGLTNAVNLSLADLAVGYQSSGGDTSNTGIPAAFLSSVASTCTTMSPNVNCDGLERLDTVANILASCINGSGPSSSQCSTLFTNTGTPSSGTVLQAARAMATDPAANVAVIYGIAPPSGMTLFEPTLSAAPADWTLGLNFDPSGANFDKPDSLAVDSSGDLWVVNFSNWTVTKLDPSGQLVSNFNNTNTSGANFDAPNSLAVDRSGNVWIANYGSNSVTELNSNGGLVGNYAPSGANFNGPVSVAVDASGDAWVTNYFNTSVTKLDSSGKLVGNFNNTNTGGANFNSVDGIAVDASGDAWVVNTYGGTTGGSVTELNSNGGLVGNYNPSGANFSLLNSIAIDSSGDAWVTNYSVSGSVTELSSSGGLVGNYVPSGANFDYPDSVAIDSSGNAWVADENSNSVTELNSSGALIGNYAPHGANFNGPVSVAIDPSGNVWAADYYGSTLSALIGLAKPVTTPLIAAITQENPIPGITSLSPASATVGGPAQTLTIDGRGFISSSTASYNGVAHTATYVSSTELTIQLTAADQATPGSYPVVVTNPGPGGGASNTVDFTVGTFTNPIPTITGLSPTAVTAGAGAQTLAINGTGFVSGSAVTYNGVAHTATYVSSTQLTIQLTASDQTTAGTYPVVVSNPSPGGGSSNTFNFTVDNPIPSVTGLSPTAVFAGSSAQTLTITGTGFLAGSTVTFNGVVQTATLGSSTQLTIPLTAGDQATGGNFAVVVTNPGPGGGASNSENFVVYTGFTAPTWQVLGPTAIPNAHSCDNANETSLFAAGKVQAFAVDLADPSTMYAAGGIGQGNAGPDSSAGIYMSTDGGKTWVQRDSGLGDTFVDALWIDQANPQILLASTWLDGVYRSQDGGATWSNVLPTQSTVILQSGSNLYVATANGASVSTDLGVTWQSVLTTPHPVRALAGEGGVLYAGLDDGTIMVEQTPGGAWNTVLTGGANPYGPSPSNVWQLAVNPSNSQEAIAVVTEAGTFENLITDNGGGSWSAWTAPPSGGLCGSGGTAAYVAYDTVTPQIIYAGAGGALYVSQDGGKSWTAEHLLEDIRLIYPFPGQSGELVVGGDQGIYLSSDTGVSWASLNGNLTTSLLNALAVNGPEIISTVQDFSPINSFDGGSTWLQLSGSSPAVGENGVVVINQGNPNYQYIFNGVGFQYSTDGGNTFTNDTSLPSGQWNFGAPIAAVAVDPQTPSTLYLAGASGVFESTDWGVTWTLTSWGFQNPSLVAVGPDGTIFVGTPATSTAPGELHISHNAGASWATFQCPISWPVSLTVDPNNTNTILMVTGAPPNVTGGGVLISTDGGNTFASDNNSSLHTEANIPSPFSNYTIQFAPAAYPGLVVLTTDDGAYISQAGSVWTNISGSAVPQFFYGLAWDSGYLYVSTYGEGVLRIPITQVLTP